MYLLVGGLLFSIRLNTNKGERCSNDCCKMWQRVNVIQLKFLFLFELSIINYIESQKTFSSSQFYKIVLLNFCVTRED